MNSSYTASIRRLFLALVLIAAVHFTAPNLMADPSTAGECDAYCQGLCKGSCEAEEGWYCDAYTSTWDGANCGCGEYCEEL